MNGKFITLLSVVLFVIACASMETHPPVTAPALCGECHIDGRSALAHTSDFFNRHQFYGERFDTDCSACHRQSFCADCHSYEEGMKPSDRFADSPQRGLPHRGDYLTRHMSDGRLDPSECFICHGRKNNDRCKDCHR